MRKKSQLMMEAIFAIIILFVFIFISMFAYKLLSDVRPDVVADVELNESKKIMNDMTDRFPNVFSGLFVLLLIGVWAFVIVAAFMSNDHPLLFAFSIIISVAIVVVGMILGNFYEEFFQDAEYATLTASFAIPNFIMTNFMKVTIVLIVTSLLISYAKNKWD